MTPDHLPPLGAPILAVCVGNTRTRFGLFVGGDLQESASERNADFDGLAGAIARLMEGSGGAAVVIASVNDPAADRLEERLAEEPGSEVFRIGRDLSIAMTHTLRDAATVGQDRLLCALGAFARTSEACVVIDAGTAVTVDFVDGRGTFHGGAIAPGLGAMLRAMHESTAALPLLRYEPPPPEDAPFGRDTAAAMRTGVQAAVIGLAHEMIDRFAGFYGAYPRIVATGGDAQALFADDPLVEHVVPDLQLLGVLAACRAAAEEEA